MGPEAFRRLLACRVVAPGTGERQALRLVDDERLEWGRGDEPDVIVRELPERAPQAPGEWLIGQVENLLAEFYRTHALSRTGFDRQARALFAEHGSQAFAAPPGRMPCFTLFVDGGSVVAEPEHSPRHRCGAYCELPAPLGADAASAKVDSWLASGEADTSYLGMNACRYNC